MEQIDGIARPRTSGEKRSAATATDAGGGVSAHNALVLVTPIAASAPARCVLQRPQPAFLAHLMAMKQRAPQTRAGRRAEPEEAAALYDAALIPEPQAAGHMLRRAV